MENCISDEKDDSLREDYKNRISRLKTQQQGLKTNLTEIKNVSTEESKLTLSKILTLLKYSKDIFNGLNLEEKSEFLKIISLNFSLKGKTVSFFYKNLIQFLSKSDPCLNILRIIDTVRTDHYEDIIEFSSYISRIDKLLESIMKKEQ